MAPPKCKIIVLGESGVGKSSLLERYSLDTFTETIAATIGVDFRMKNFKFTPSTSSSSSSASGSSSNNAGGGIDIALNLWDTAGQERYRALSSSFYRGTDAIILVYDVSNEHSFNGVRNWLDQARAFLPDTPALLIANKIDLFDVVTSSNNTIDDEWRQSEESKAREFAEEHQMLYCRCSAKTKEGVASAFEAIAQKACDTPEYKEKSGITAMLNNNSNNNDGGQQQQEGGKRIDLNAARNNNNDDQNQQGYYGCSQC